MLLASALAAQCQQQTAALQSSRATPQIVERGPHHRVWEIIELEPTPSGGTREKVHRYTELATGMHFQKDGQWQETRTEISILPSGGAVADKGPHKARFAPNLNSSGAIELDTPDGKTLRSHVLGLSYLDTATGKSVLIAEIKDTIGQLLPSKNQILYGDAFDGVKADIRYTYMKAGFEQDIIFREQPPSPEEWGLNPKTTMLQVLTEFIAPPQPRKSSVLESGGANNDRTLSFGEMSVGLGRAFSENEGKGKSSGVPVGKNWQKLDGRDFLIEEVSFDSATRELKNLPKPQASLGTAERIKRTASIDRHLPVAPSVSGDDKAMLVAAQEPAQNGYVVDYQLLGGSTNAFVFQGDTTYYVTEEFVVNGPATIEGGAVVKFAESVDAFLTFNGAVVCETGPYRPAVFTAQDDDTVGEILSESSGVPSAYYGSGLYITSTSNRLDHLRFLYFKRAIYAGAAMTIANSQFASGLTGIVVVNTANKVLNTLFSNVEEAIGVSDALVSGQHLTFDQCYYVVIPYDGGGSGAALTNCLVTAASDWSTDLVWATNACVVLSSASGVYQDVGGGGYYLAGGTYRNVGTTNIDAALLVSLKQTTTYPPTVYSSTTISTTTNLGLQAIRDTDAPDLGYHYDPLDYAFGETYVTTNLTFSPGVAAGWFFLSSSSYGIRIADQKILTFDGRLDSQCHWVRCNAVQEGTTGNWAGGGGSGGIIGTADQYAKNVALSPEVRARFTKFSALNYGGNFFRDHYGYIIVRAQDCEFASSSAAGYINSLILTNCLFDRVSLGNVYGWTGTVFTAQNCTFRGGTLYLQRSTGTGGQAIPLTVRDCAFDGTSFSLAHNYANANVSYSYNAFTNGAARLIPTNSNDRLMASFNWQTGPLGNFYQPTTSTNLNVGSTYATNVGLYHFTVTTNQVKETNTVVDIGYHYVALGTNGLAFDLDDDGLADFWEDRNGNGSVESSETHYLEADSDFDGINDGEELASGTDPLNAASTTQKMLASFRFNSTNWIGDQGQLPDYTRALTSGSGLEGAGVPITGAPYSKMLRYRTVEPNGRPNLSFASGTVSFWFKPNWASRSTGGAGPDPEAVGRFFNLGEWSDPPVQSFWSLFQYDYHDASGTVIGFNSYTNGAAYGAGAAMAHFRSNQWHQIVLTYSPSSVTTWIDGTNAASASGCTIVPDKATRDYGFLIGSDTAGHQQAQGTFDLVETFNYPLSSSQIASNYLHVLNSGQAFGARIFRPTSTSSIP